MGGKRHSLHVRRGDTVEVVAGNARGARGRILRALPQEGKVVVEGINMVWKHLRRSRQNPQGGRIQIEAPIDASNVMLICPHRDCERHDRPVRTRSTFAEDGRKMRVCVRCGTEIPRVE
ncbi:MAG: 50S ribosomal protein L24 [Candidatus Brocadiaceae bacterium]|jgi:large subunit ribosomal protein L24